MEKTDRTERLLALILLNQMKGLPQREKIIQLNIAGFTNVEIADIVETTTNNVAKEISGYKKVKGQRTSKNNSKIKEEISSE